MQKLKENMLKHEANLSIYATRDEDAIRLKDETEDIVEKKSKFIANISYVKNVE